MKAHNRQEYIMDILDKKGIVYLAELSEELHASICSIRRDFDKLEKENKCKRIHGGAVLVRHNSFLNEETSLHMNERERMNMEEKISLCKKCAELVNDNDCIFVDGGTTFMHITEFLNGKHVTIVTHSNLIHAKDNATYVVYIIGGENNARFKMNLGPMALSCLERFHFDEAFIGCAGFSVDDLNAYTAEMETAKIKQAAIEKATKSYLVLDSSKIGIYGFYNFINLNDLTGLMITKSDLKLKTTARIYVAEMI